MLLGFCFVAVCGNPASANIFEVKSSNQAFQDGVPIIIHCLHGYRVQAGGSTKFIATCGLDGSWHGLTDCIGEGFSMGEEQWFPQFHTIAGSVSLLIFWLCSQSWLYCEHSWGICAKPHLSLPSPSTSTAVPMKGNLQLTQNWNFVSC